ncbi:5 10-methylenetetrahydrofolate reductase [Lucifera butyrica]|uniref:Methylenetetrahydrofolate reductase n=1 Tax=Lucifera butyrica TaxID=1351585 RepID=A0A498RCE5_9FIRM|nr:methylenetetrahydrofolate reductase [NAD(P)H] [Lucifera butyrica]VBB08685.1 5 10-methylenetetrahydrofolate reductase [Lucifera butyrica]
MQIHSLFGSGKAVVSFEIFPPKPNYSLDTIFATLDGLKELKPDFISVTYGAGGSSTERSIEIADKVKNEYHIETLAHLTCVGSTRGDIEKVLNRFSNHNIENVLALRGDPPQGQAGFAASNPGYKYAGDLVAHIKERTDFCVAAAAYPEGHLECPDLNVHFSHLKAKVDQGVDFLITQLFFDNNIFFTFLDKARAQGIYCPVVVGIMPVLNAAQIKRMTSLCGASVPDGLQRILEKYANSAADMEKAGIEYACRQINNLLENHADGIHLYTMNKAEQARIIMHQTGLR